MEGAFDVDRVAGLAETNISRPVAAKVGSGLTEGLDVRPGESSPVGALVVSGLVDRAGAVVGGFQAEVVITISDELVGDGLANGIDRLIPKVLAEGPDRNVHGIIDVCSIRYTGGEVITGEQSRSIVAVEHGFQRSDLGTKKPGEEHVFEGGEKKVTVVEGKGVIFDVKTGSTPELSAEVTLNDVGCARSNLVGADRNLAAGGTLTVTTLAPGENQGIPVLDVILAVEESNHLISIESEIGVFVEAHPAVNGELAKHTGDITGDVETRGRPVRENVFD